MTLYSVYERPNDAPTAVADRFSWSAALLPPVHALVHGLWLLLTLWVVGTVAIIASSVLVGGEAAFWLYVLMAILVGFEAAALRRGALRRDGWHHVAEIVAPAPDVAEVEWIKRRHK